MDIDASLELSKEAVKAGGGKMMGYVIENGVSFAKKCLAESQNMVLEGVTRGACKTKDDSCRFEEVTGSEGDKKKD